MDRPIPAFYCVYLLRSKRSPLSSLYIGSTPNPKRRLRQHNGGAKGGAKRTQSSNRRPWKMCVIVTGFPSKIAALQFEWAWQHPWRTRHIDRSELPPHKLNHEYTHKRLHGCVHHLHMLLRYKTFARWPLQVRFFSFDAHQAWQNYLTQTNASFPSHISTQLMSNDAATIAKPRASKKNQPPVQTEQDVSENEPQTSIEDIDATYQPCKEQIEMSRKALAEESLHCTVCKRALDINTDHILFCNHDCSMSAHLICLSTSFLHEEHISSAFVPTTGSCPKCRTPLLWSDLVKDLSLRMRGQVYVKKLLKKPRGRRNGTHGKSKEADESPAELDDAIPSEVEEFSDIDYVDPEDEDPQKKTQRSKKRKTVASTKKQSPVRKKANVSPVEILNSDSDDVEIVSD